MALMDFFPALFGDYFIKIIFLLHATLVSLANIFSSGPSAQVFTYASYNLPFLLCILLAVLVDKNTDILLVGLTFNVICIVLDLLLVITGFSFGWFATIIVVLNMLMRPVSSILLLKNYSARAGVEDPTNGLLEVNVAPSTVPRARSAYQNIDEPSQTLP